MILYRVAAETRQYAADDLSGRGAAVSPGRWNEPGQAVVYTATTRALAVLETAAHVKAGGLPLNRYLIEVDVDASVWRKRAQLERDNLPVGWDAIPAGMASVKMGAEWLSAGASALLEVPSVIVPEETAVLVNPGHPDMRGIRAVKVRPLEFDRLFRL